LPPKAKLQAIVTKYIDTTKTPGVLVGIWTPQGNWVKGTGTADLASGAPLTSDMQYKIASQTKPFTTDLILQLVGEGKVSLDDHIDRWVPGVPNGGQITIRQLLNHTSGLGDISEEDSPDVFVPSSPAYAKLQAGVALRSCSPLAVHPLRRQGRRGTTATMAMSCSAGWSNSPLARICQQRSITASPDPSA
jgi:CubicO group peptidase (beta-lactamase class C family)